MMYARRYTVSRTDLRSDGQKIGTKDDDGKTRARARGKERSIRFSMVNSLVPYRHSRRDKGKSRSSPDVGATVNVVSPGRRAIDVIYIHTCLLLK